MRKLTCRSVVSVVRAQHFRKLLLFHQEREGQMIQLPIPPRAADGDGAGLVVDVGFTLDQTRVADEQRPWADVLTHVAPAWQMPVPRAAVGGQCCWRARVKSAVSGTRFSRSKQQLASGCTGVCCVLSLLCDLRNKRTEP